MFAKRFWSPLHAGSVLTFLPGEQVICLAPAILFSLTVTVGPVT